MRAKMPPRIESRTDAWRTLQLPMAKKFERHRQPWTPAEIGKLRLMAGKEMSLKTIATSLTRSEESVKKQAKIEKLKISKAR